MSFSFFPKLMQRKQKTKAKLQRKFWMKPLNKKISQLHLSLQDWVVCENGTRSQTNRTLWTCLATFSFHLTVLESMVDQTRLDTRWKRRIRSSRKYMVNYIMMNQTECIYKGSQKQEKESNKTKIIESVATVKECWCFIDENICSNLFGVLQTKDQSHCLKLISWLVSVSNNEIHEMCLYITILFKWFNFPLV